MNHKMTANERLVWAAVFAKELNLHNLPSIGVQDGDAWAEWERGQVSMAAECATGAVMRLRQTVPAVVDGFGLESAVFQHVAQMTSGEF